MVHGNIDQLTTRWARGWACHTQDPNQPVTIRARLQDDVISQIRVETPEPSPIFRSGKKQLAHRFCIEFSTPLTEGEQPSLSIEALQGEGKSWVRLSRPSWVKRSDVEQGATQDANEGPHQGFEAITPTVVPFWSDRGLSLPFAPTDCRPVFVLGPVRSGTSALSLALEKGTRYQGFGEGHIFDLAIRLDDAVRQHWRFKKTHLRSGDVAGYHLGHTTLDQVQDGALCLMRYLASGFNTPFWFDKTPTPFMVESAAILARAFPGARFIFMRRRGLENVSSRMRRFSSANFFGCCANWRGVMHRWRTTRDLIAGRYLELDQHDMAIDPIDAATRVGNLLGLESVEIEAVGSILRGERPEATAPADQIIRNISELSWSEVQMATFREICGPEMEAYGYTYDERYSVEPGTR